MLKTEMVCFYTSIILTIISHMYLSMIGRSQEPVFKLGTPFLSSSLHFGLVKLLCKPPTLLLPFDFILPSLLAQLILIAPTLIFLPYIFPHKYTLMYFHTSIHHPHKWDLHQPLQFNHLHFTTTLLLHSHVTILFLLPRLS